MQCYTGLNTWFAPLHMADLQPCPTRHPYDALACLVSTRATVSEVQNLMSSTQLWLNPARCSRSGWANIGCSQKLMRNWLHCNFWLESKFHYPITQFCTAPTYIRELCFPELSQLVQWLLRLRPIVALWGPWKCAGILNNLMTRD